MIYNGPNRKKLRLKDYDYSKGGMYFVTLCTKEREIFFGTIKNENVELNTYGKIAEECWLNIEKHYENIKVHDFVIMPNHIHAIITIVEKKYFDSGKKPNLSNVIKGFKIGVTKEIRNTYEDYIFGWQKSFFDKIITTEQQLLKTKDYIECNPKKWEQDINNPENIEKEKFKKYGEKFRKM